MIGNAKYQCSCVRYVILYNTPLIVGLTVAIILLLIIVIISIVVYRRLSYNKQINSSLR